MPMKPAGPGPETLARLGVVVLMSALSPPAEAQTWRVGARLGGSAERIPSELSQTRFVSGTTAPQPNTGYALRLRAFGEVEGRPVDILGLIAGIDSGLLEVSDRGVQLDRRPAETQLKNTFLLGRVQAELQLGKNGVVAIRAGRYQPQVGAGAVFDAYAFGVDIDVDLSLVDGPPITILARALLPDGTFTDLRKTSPLLDFQVGYRFGWRSYIKVVGSVFFDTNSELVDPVRGALFKGGAQEFGDAVRLVAPFLGGDTDAAARVVLDWVNANIAIETEGVIAWTGLQGRFGDDRYTLWITALGAFGNLTVSSGPTQQRIETFQGADLSDDVESAFIEAFTTARSVDVQAFFGEVRSRFVVGEVLQLDTFALVLTGDRGLRLDSESPRLHGFLGLSPLLPRTAVFFGGTFGPDQATPTAFSITPDSSGIVAAGLETTVFVEDLVAGVNVAIMYALVPSRFTDRQFYGFEVDFRGQYPIYDGLEVFVDGGVLFPGGFFEDQTTAIQVVAGLQYFMRVD